MNKKYIYYILLLALLTDLGYAFLQDLKMPLDGDMATCIVPGNDIKKILEDPFGISVITKKAVYPNPNRFFVHWTFFTYFRHAPIALQRFVNPIDSVYLSCALIKIIIQILILILLSFYITGSGKIFTRQFLLAAVVIAPLFQINGYEPYLCIIDKSITYTFFYALPCTFLLLFYLPFFMASFYKTNFTSNKFIEFFLLVLSVILSLSGPLIPGIVLVITLLFILNRWHVNYESSSHLNFIQRVLAAINKIPKAPLLFFAFISVLSIYSLYIGSHNSFFVEHLPLLERYYRIPIGLFGLLTTKIGYPLFLLMLAVNTFIIYKYFRTEGAKFLTLFKWTGIFTLVYILLLPLGGYKSYRPLIVRFDTMMPVTIGLICIYGMTTCFLIGNIKGNSRLWYLVLVITFSAIFKFADEPQFEGNKCEREAIETISRSDETIVPLKSDCYIMAWGEMKTPEESELNAELFEYWGITKGKKLYYQR